MTKILAVALWAVGMAAVATVATLLARRWQQAGSTATRPAATARGRSHASARASGIPPWAVAIIRLGAFLAVGALATYGVMVVLGVLVVHQGPAIDRPFYHWMSGHQLHLWARVMARLTKIGNTWTTWGAAGAAAACLTVTWRKTRWLPPVALSGLIVIDHFVTLALRHTFHRLGPPDSPLGTYPSGGCDRVVVFYGLIAYLLWREFSGRRVTAIWTGAAVAALGFNEAYSRAYLGLHWLTDALSGVCYGCLQLAVFIIAIRLVAGRAPGRPALPGTSAIPVSSALPGRSARPGSVARPDSTALPRRLAGPGRAGQPDLAATQRQAMDQPATQPADGIHA